MALIVEFAVPLENFALSQTLTAVQDATLEIGRLTVDSSNSVTASVWAYTTDFDALETALEDDPTVGSFAVTSETTDERSYRMRWNEPIELLVHVLTPQEGSIIYAANTDSVWTLHVSFPERRALVRVQELQELAQRNGFSLAVQRIYQTGEYRQRLLGLTDRQHEVLVSAFHEGYFEIPKKVTLKELAEKHGVSHQAVSEQIRRGIHQVLQQTLITERASTAQEE